MKGVKRAPLKCMYCDFVACLECCKKYILENPIPQCMNIKSVCSREWTRKFLVESFPHNFLNIQYKTHRENILLEQERALFVETQPYVINEIEKEKVFDELTKVNSQIVQLNKVYGSLLARHRELYRKVTHERQCYTRCCPKNGCRGFLTQQWKCGICETKFCKSCHQPVDSNTETTVEPTEDSTGEPIEDSLEEPRNEFIYTNEEGTSEEPLAQTAPTSSRIQHVCNQDDVETAKLLEKNTKPCPSCSMGIFKIDGCNQMFCTNCNTAFHWVTRNIMNVNIHNPHYFEWIRNQAANEASGNINRPANNNCQNDGITNETSMSLLRIIRIERNITEAQKEEILEFVRVCRNILHIREVVMPQYLFNYAERNREIRILFMRNKITESEFKRYIQKNDKKHSKSQEIYHVYQFLVNSSSDIILRYLDSLKRKIVSNSAMKEVEAIVEYANKCFTEISNTYRSKRIFLPNNLHI